MFKNMFKQTREIIICEPKVVPKTSQDGSKPPPRPPQAHLVGKLPPSFRSLGRLGPFFAQQGPLSTLQKSFRSYACSGFRAFSKLEKRSAARLGRVCYEAAGGVRGDRGSKGRPGRPKIAPRCPQELPEAPQDGLEAPFFTPKFPEKRRRPPGAAGTDFAHAPRGPNTSKIAPQPSSPP